MSTETTWTAWVRMPGQRWEAVASAATEEEAWETLREHTQQLPGKLIDLYVGRSTINPNQKTSRRRCF